MCGGQHGRRHRAVRCGGDRPSKLCSGASLRLGAGPSRHPRTHVLRCGRYSERMTVREMLTALQALPRDAELLAFVAG
jgi:hypothetical protein